MTRPNNPTHSETVRLAIERDIFSGKLVPGQALDEEEIAERFSVSRTPVREAMLQLVQSGLIEKRPRQGAIVATMDIGRMIQMFEVMSELEGMCGRIAARRMTADERQALSELHRQTDDALNAGEHDLYYTLSRRFHVLVINGTHNEVLIGMTNSLGQRLVPYRRFQLNYPGRSEANLLEHTAILRAIVDGDSEEACRLLRKHTTVQGDVLADYISMTAVPKTLVRAAAN